MHDGHQTMNTDNDCTATLLSDADVIAAMREIPPVRRCGPRPPRH